MKKNLISLCAFALSFIAFSSCNKVEDETSQTVKFKVLSEVSTKTHLVDGKTVWSKNDVIYVLGSDGARHKSDPITESGLEASEFTFSSFPQTPQYALYVGRTQTPGVENGTIAATLPSEQSMSITKSFCNSANLAIGEVVKVDESTYGSTLKNVCGLMKLTVPSGIKSVKIEGNNEEILSGAISIDYNAGEPTWSAIQGENIVNIIPRKNSDGIYVGSDYYACILPQTFEKGVTVTLTDINGNTAVTSGSNPLTLKRNKVVELPNLNIPKAPATVLEFDFLDTKIYPEGFPTGSENAITPNSVNIKATNGVAYNFGVESTSIGIFKSTDIGFCLFSKGGILTFPTIENKNIICVEFLSGNKTKMIRKYDNGILSEAFDFGHQDTQRVVKVEGENITGIVATSSNTVLDKLVLTYE